MQIDQKMLNRLLNMNDDQLGSLLQEIAKEAGIDPSTLGINPKNIADVRQALGNATNDDLQKMNAAYEEYRRQRRTK